MNLIKSSLLSLVSLVSINSVSLAEGAIVKGTIDHTEFYVYSYNAKTQNIANRRALRSCRLSGARNCRVISYIPSRSWVAVATDNEGTKAWAISPDYNYAYSQALDACNELSLEESCDISSIRYSY